MLTSKLNRRIWELNTTSTIQLFDAIVEVRIGLGQASTTPNFESSAYIT